MTQKPGADEFAPYYARYIHLVPEGDIVETLQRQLAETLALLAPLTDEQAGYRYQPGKWSVAEVIGHINDTERIFACRALRIARGDQTPLPGFDQDPYVLHSPAARMSLPDLAGEFASIRRASITLLHPFDPAAWLRRGTASDHPVSVRALAWMLAGHERHHVNILRERYLAPRA